MAQAPANQAEILHVVANLLPGQLPIGGPVNIGVSGMFWTVIADAKRPRPPLPGDECLFDAGGYHVFDKKVGDALHVDKPATLAGSAPQGDDIAPRLNRVPGIEVRIAKYV